MGLVSNSIIDDLFIGMGLGVKGITTLIVFIMLTILTLFLYCKFRIRTYVGFILPVAHIFEYMKKVTKY